MLIIWRRVLYSTAEKYLFIRCASLLLSKISFKFSLEMRFYHRACSGTARYNLDSRTGDWELLRCKHTFMQNSLAQIFILLDSVSSLAITNQNTLQPVNVHKHRQWDSQKKSRSTTNQIL